MAPRGARMKGVGTGTFSFRYPQAYCPPPGFDGEFSRTEDSFTEILGSGARPFLTARCLLPTANYLYLIVWAMS